MDKPSTFTWKGNVDGDLNPEAQFNMMYQYCFINSEITIVKKAPSTGDTFVPNNSIRLCAVGVPSELVQSFAKRKYRLTFFHSLCLINSSHALLGQEGISNIEA